MTTHRGSGTRGEAPLHVHTEESRTPIDLPHAQLLSVVTQADFQEGNLGEDPPPQVQHAGPPPPCPLASAGTWHSGPDPPPRGASRSSPPLRPKRIPLSPRRPSRSVMRFSRTLPVNPSLWAVSVASSQRNFQAGLTSLYVPLYKKQLLDVYSQGRNRERGE